MQEIRCLVCSGSIDIEVKDQLAYCQKCETYSHQKCWDYNGGCGRYGCNPSPKRVVVPGVSHDSRLWSAAKFVVGSMISFLIAYAIAYKNAELILPGQLGVYYAWGKPVVAKPGEVIWGYYIRPAAIYNLSGTVSFSTKVIFQDCGPATISGCLKYSISPSVPEDLAELYENKRYDEERLQHWLKFCVQSGLWSHSQYVDVKYSLEKRREFENSIFDQERKLDSSLINAGVCLNSLKISNIEYSASCQEILSRPPSKP